MRHFLAILLVIFTVSVVDAQVLYTKDGKSVSPAQIALGLVDGAETLTLVGFNNSVSTTQETLWPGSAPYVWPTSATAATLSSASANDIAAGTGCQSARVRYVNASGAEVDETLALNGQTAVSLTSTTLGVNSIQCVTAGTGLTNAAILYVGTGTVTAGVPATVYNRAETGHGRSSAAFWVVPSSRAVLLMDIDIGVTVAQINEYYLYKQISGGSFNMVGAWITQLGGVFTRSFPQGPVYFPALSKLRLDGKSQTSNANGRANLTLIQFDTSKFDLTRFIPVQ